MQPTTTAYQTAQARQESFERARIIGTSLKSRAKKNFLSWPHEAPGVDEMAAAGFFFAPTKEINDRVECFFCHQSFSQWQENDDPALEHVKLCPNCPWAKLCSKVAAEWAQTVDAHTLAGTEHDPYSALNYEGRLGTFVNWPYEKRRGWKPKSVPLAQAGFHFVPQCHNDDTTECALCGITLNGWEPRDDPINEHRRRRPDCLFFLSAPKEVRWSPNISPKKVMRRKVSPVLDNTQSIDISANAHGTPLAESILVVEQEADQTGQGADGELPSCIEVSVQKTCKVPELEPEVESQDEPEDLQDAVLETLPETELDIEPEALIAVEANTVPEVVQQTGSTEPDTEAESEIDNISHPSTVEIVDQILSFDNGRVINHKSKQDIDVEITVNHQNQEVLANTGDNQTLTEEALRTENIVHLNPESTVTMLDSKSGRSMIVNMADITENSHEAETNEPQESINATQTSKISQLESSTFYENIEDSANVKEDVSRFSFGISSTDPALHEVDPGVNEHANSSQFRPREIVDLANASHISAADFSMAAGECSIEEGNSPDATMRLKRTSPVTDVNRTKRPRNSLNSENSEFATAPSLIEPADASKVSDTSIVKADQSTAKRSFLAAWMHSTPSALKHALSPRRLFGQAKMILPSPLGGLADTKPSPADCTFTGNGPEFSMIGDQLVTDSEPVKEIEQIPELDTSSSSIETVNETLLLPSLDSLLDNLSGLTSDTLSELAMKKYGQSPRQWLEIVADQVTAVMNKNTERLVAELEKQREQAIQAILRA